MCPNFAVATLTYVYAESTAVLGPLATYAEPHCYDLCEAHTNRLTPPKGWELVKLETDPATLQPSSADLAALADAVRQAGTVAVEEPSLTVGARRGHLHVVRDSE
ncbi:MAG: hypothetical protein RIS43_570 [Actinomycetota bacterium]|jgi:hypothetical protein